MMPVLKVADPTTPYALQMDASDRGLGAVLSQVQCYLLVGEGTWMVN